MPLNSTRVQRFARGMVAILPAPLAGLLRRLKRAALNTRPRREVFSQIARSNSWDGTESVSGPGSTMEATALLRGALPELLRKHDIKIFLDIPCGDAFWIGEALPRHVTYIGADIVPDLIARNRAERSDLGSFEVLDLVSDDLPKADLVMVRDCFIHLPHTMVKKAIANIKRSGVRYLLTTTYPGRAENIDIEIGGFRPLDLQAAPYNFPGPLETILETEGINCGKSMALWEVSKL